MPKGRPPRKNLPAKTPPTGALIPAPTPTLQEQAKEMYLAYKTPDEIIGALGISSSQLSEWRHNHEWVAEREERERALLEDRFAVRRRKISESADVAVEQVKRALTHLADRPEPPSITEGEKASAILERLDKLNRLDLGRATENVAVAGKLSVEKIRDIIKADPFFVEPAQKPEG